MAQGQPAVPAYRYLHAYADKREGGASGGGHRHVRFYRGAAVERLPVRVARHSQGREAREGGLVVLG